MTTPVGTAIFDTEVLTQKCSGGNKGDPVSGSGPPSESDARGRLMCFTWFHEAPIKFDGTSMTYLGYGEEICPDTGRSHLQGYVMWKNARWHFACRKKFKAWFKVCSGTLQDQINYCSKDGKYKEWGNVPAQGKRTDLNTVKDEILSLTKRVDDIVVENPMLYHQYGRTLERLEIIAMRKLWRKEMTTCDWYWGGTGVGKSHTAFMDYDPEKVYVWTDDRGWWNGYRQQEIVVINEFRGEISFQMLLQLVDKWPFNVTVRNIGPVPFISKKIIITSCSPPDQVYKRSCDDHDKFDQLMRRINVVHMMSHED